MGDVPAWSLTGVLSVDACACARALHWSGVPSVLQGRGLFPGNWLVQKPGRSSQQWGGNTRPVTLLVISRDKAEKRWDKLCVCVCVHLCIRVHMSVWDKGVSLLISNYFTQVSPVRIAWQQWKLTVLGFYILWSPLPSRSPVAGQHAVIGPAIKPRPGAPNAPEGWCTIKLLAGIEVIGSACGTL